MDKTVSPIIFVISIDLGIIFFAEICITSEDGFGKIERMFLLSEFKLKFAITGQLVPIPPELYIVRLGLI